MKESNYYPSSDEVPAGYVRHQDGRVLPGPGALRTEEGRKQFDKLLQDAGIADEDSPLRIKSSA